MGSRGFLLAIGGSILLLIVWVLSRSNMRVTEAATVGERSESASGGHAELAAPDMPAAARTGRDPVAPGAAAVRFVGRCVHALIKAPLSGVSVRLAVWPPVRARAGEVGTPLWETRTASDRDGRFAVGCPVLAVDQLVQLFFEHEAFCARRGRWRGLAAGATQVLADVELLPGATVRGAVRTEDGAPLPQGYLAVRMRGIDAGGNEPEPEKHCAEPDEHGRFCVGGLPEGEHVIEAAFAGYADPRPPTVRVRPDLASLPPVSIVLRRLPSVAGIVVDRAGRPVAGAAVEFAASPDMAVERRLALLHRCESQADGSFALLAALDAGADQISVAAWAEGFREGRSAEVPWGTRDVRIVLDPATRLRVRALERATHAAIEDYRVRIWRADRPVDDVARAPRLGGSHPGGVLDIPHLSDARYWLSVEAPGYAASLPVLVTVSDADGQVEVLLDRAARASVQLVDAAGQPAAAALVELLLGPREQALRVTSTFSDMLRNPGLTARVRVLAAAATNAEGRAIFPDLPPCTFHVRCRDPRRPFVLAGPYELVPGEQRSLEVRLPPGCRVEARIVPEALVPFLTGVQLVSAAEPQLAVPMLAPASVAADGTVVLDPVPRGTWRPRLRCRVRDHATGGDVAVPYELDPLRLDDARFAGEIDAATLLPSTLRCRVLAGGRPAAAGSRCELVGSHGGSRWRSAVATLDADGRADFAGLPPGSYRLQLCGSEDAQGEEPIPVPARGEVTVRLGARPR